MRRRHGAVTTNGGRDGAAIPREWTQAELVECVVETLRQLLAVGDDFSPQSDLVGAGLDSLAVTQLMLAIEDRTGIWVDESRLTPENLRSAETLAACVYEQLAGT